jgi:hypothetical protein
VNVKPLIPFVLTALLWGLIYLCFEMKINPSQFPFKDAGGVYFGIGG